MSIQKTPLSERPRERCIENGPTCLSLRECLALLIGSGPKGLGCLGIASQILSRPGSGLDPMEEERAFFTAMEVSGPAFVKEFRGLGPAGQARLLAAFELGRRYASLRHPPHSHSSQELDKKETLPHLARRALNRITIKQRHHSQEWFGFVPVYQTGRLGEFCSVEKGVRTHVNVDPAELFARILSLRPKGIFLFHNHPSGSLTPSQADFLLSQKVEELSAEFNIQLFGHWIVTAQSEYWISSQSIRLTLSPEQE